jgi:hypothetical protein
MKYKDLEAKLYRFTRSNLFKDNNRSLEEALEEALELVPEKEEPEKDGDEEWI